MAFSNRHLALLDLVSTLEGITQGSGFATTIQVVHKRAIDWHESRRIGALPCIGVLPLACPFTHISPAQMLGRQDVAVEFAYAASDDDEVWETGDVIVDDIIAAVLADRTRGGYAIGTEIASIETEQGNPDTMDSAGGTAAGIVRVTLIFQRQMVVS